jgi:hypothetical protein
MFDWVAYFYLSVYICHRPLPGVLICCKFLLHQKEYKRLVDQITEAIRNGDTEKGGPALISQVGKFTN